MRIDNVPETSSDFVFVSAWLEDLREAFETMTHPREQVVKRRMRRQIEVLERLKSMGVDAGF